MLRQSQKLKKISTLIFLLFLISLCSALTFGHLFRAPPLSGKDIERYATLFTDQDFQELSTIFIKNQLGNFQLEKQSDTWNLKYPKLAKVEDLFIEGFIETLKNIKIKKTFKPDPINMANFSLTTPLVEIVLIKQNAERQIIRLGLINPVDNSTYLTTTDQNIIYHIDALSTSLNALNLADLTESKIFSFNKDDLSSLKIFKGVKKIDKIFLAISKNAEGWGSREGSILNKVKVNLFLEKLLNLKSLSSNSSNQDVLKNLKNAQILPLYTLEMEGSDHKMVTYSIYPITKDMLENELETELDSKEKSTSLVLIKASNKEFPSIVTSDALNILEKNEKDF